MLIAFFRFWYSKKRVKNKFKFICVYECKGTQQIVIANEDEFNESQFDEFVVVIDRVC